MLSVALSSSGFKFPAHAGALHGLETWGREIVEIAGSSGGALVGGLYACGMTTREIIKWSLHSNWVAFLDPRFSSFFKKGLTGAEGFEEELKRLIGDKTFKEIDIDLKICTADIISYKPVIFSATTTPDVPIRLAIRASISIPLVFSPVQFEDKMLVDGAVFNSLPLNLLNRKDTKKIGVRTAHMDPARMPAKTLIGVAKNSLYAMADAGNLWAIEAYAGATGATLYKLKTEFVDGMNPVMTLAQRKQLVKAGFQEVLVLPNGV